MEVRGLQGPLRDSFNRVLVAEFVSGVWSEKGVESLEGDRRPSLHELRANTAPSSLPYVGLYNLYSIVYVQECYLSIILGKGEIMKISKYRGL